eukprot:TRINITY_DN67875_c0_g1_i1.p1 TRINITY_DN67875_c0_g1~~TRINITY_DN67875_c0_g1_i1.p1  ORF type:complete len:754 (-),score=130.56 TRINITY_DN67875_c0_g1_i1:139-2400(-)
MGRPAVASLHCTACGNVCSVPCLELEEANAIIDGLRKLLVQSQLAYFEVDSSGSVTNWSKKASDVFDVVESDAFGQPLKDLVADKHRSRVQHILSRSTQRGSSAEAQVSTVTLAGRGSMSGNAAPIGFSGSCGGGGTGTENTFSVVPFYGSVGRVLGAAALAQPESASNKGVARLGLPSPVGGVVAWRCTSHNTGTVPLMFEMSQAKGGPPVGESYKSEVETAVQEAISANGDSQGPFESEIVPFEGEDGATQYFFVRGVSTNGPELPFGGRLTMAEGYVVDVTALRLALQEEEKWHERWRMLAQLAYSFMLLVDISEYRVVSSWGEVDIFGERLEGQPVFSFVPQDSQSATIDAFSASLLAITGTHSQPLVFWQRCEKRRIHTECAMVSDAGDPSVLFMGAAITPQSKEGWADGSASSSDLVNARLAMLGKAKSSPPKEDAKTEEPAVAASGCQAEKDSAAKPNAKTSTGVRLTAAVLGLANVPLPPPGNRANVPLTNQNRPKAAGNTGKQPATAKDQAVEGADPARRDSVESVEPEAGASAAEKEKASAKAGTQKSDGIRLTPAALGLASMPLPPPGYRSSPLANNASRPKASSLGRPRGPPTAPSMASSLRSGSTCGTGTGTMVSVGCPGRVWPTQIVVHDDCGNEIWRSSTQLLSETLAPADLLLPAGHQLFGMPPELAEKVTPETHILFILEECTGDWLQLANVAGTTLHSLSRQASAEGKLTIGIDPLEASEEAFETFQSKANGGPG